MDYINVLNAVIELFIILSIGFSLEKLKMIPDGFRKGLSNVIFSVLYPAAIINSMVYPFSKELLMESGILFSISVGFFTLSFIFAVYIPDRLAKNINDIAIYKFNTMFSNGVLMAFPLIMSLYGKKGFFYLSMFIIPFHLLFNSVGIIIMKKGKFKSRIKLKDFINPPIIAVFIGLTVFIFQVPLPQFAKNTLDTIGSSYVPMGMIIGGIVLGEKSFAGIFSEYKVYVFTVIRLLVMPLILLFILLFLKLNPIFVTIAVLVMGMPAPATSVVLSEKFNKNSYLSAQCVFISTIFSLITIPLLLLIINLVIK